MNVCMVVCDFCVFYWGFKDVEGYVFFCVEFMEKICEV